MRFAFEGLGCGFGYCCDGCDTTLAGEGIGVAGIDDEGACRAFFQRGGAPVNRGRRGLRHSEAAGDSGAGIKQGQQNIGPALVADAGCGSGKFHAVDCWQGLETGAWGEGRDGMGHVLVRYCRNDGDGRWLLLCRSLQVAFAGAAVFTGGAGFG